MNFGDLKAQYLRAIDEYTATKAVTEDRVAAILNAAHRRVYYSREWSWTKWPVEESFTTEAGVRTYALHPSCGKLRTLWDITRQCWAPLVDTREWEGTAVNRSAMNVQQPTWQPGPVWPVGEQPAEASVITVFFSSDVETYSNLSVIIEGITEDNLFRTEEVEVEVAHGGGEWRYTATSTTLFTHLLHLALVGDDWDTIVPNTLPTVIQGEDVNTDPNLMILYPGERGRDYLTLEATETPADGQQYLYTFTRRCPVLVRDGDRPALHPNELADIIVYDALLEEAAYNSEMLPAVDLWKQRYDTLWARLVEASETKILGSLPRTVRDLDGLGGGIRYIN